MTRQDALGLIYSTANIMGVPTPIAVGLAHQASNINSLHPHGIMRVSRSMEPIARRHGWNIDTPAGNIVAGISMLHHLIRDSGGHIGVALERYFDMRANPHPNDIDSTTFAHGVLRIAHTIMEGGEGVAGSEQGSNQGALDQVRG